MMHFFVCGVVIGTTLGILRLINCQGYFWAVIALAIGYMVIGQGWNHWWPQHFPGYGKFDDEFVLLAPPHFDREGLPLDYLDMYYIVTVASVLFVVFLAWFPCRYFTETKFWPAAASFLMSAFLFHLLVCITARLHFSLG